MFNRPITINLCLCNICCTTLNNYYTFQASKGNFWKLNINNFSFLKTFFLCWIMFISWSNIHLKLKQIVEVKNYEELKQTLAL